MQSTLNPASPPLGPLPLAVAGLVLVIGLALTGLAVQQSRMAVQSEAQQRFSQQMERLDASVHTQFESPLDGVRGLKGLFAATGGFTGPSLKAWVASLNLTEDYPGTRSFGYLERVRRDQRERFVASERKNQSSAFTVQTTGTAPDLYVVKYIEPLERNRSAWGWDAGSDTALRESIERIIVTGEPALARPQTTGPTNPWNGDYLYLEPLFKTGASTQTVAEREAAFAGVAFAQITVEDLLLPTLLLTESVADFDVHDAHSTGHPALVFSSVSPTRTRQDAFTSTEFGARRFHTSKALVIGGRRLALEGGSSAAFEARIDWRTPFAIAAGGSTLSALLSVVFWLILVGRARAQAMARAMTKDLNRLAHVVRSTSHVVMVFDLQRNIVWVNEAFTRVTGVAAADALGKNFFSLFGMEHNPPAFLQQSRAAQERGENLRMQVPWKLSTGETLWFDVDFQAERDANQQISGYVAVAADITPQQRASEKLAIAVRENQALMDAIDQHSIVSIADHRGTITYVNDMFCQISGFSREELLGNNHRIVKSNQQPAAFWEQMWKTVSSGYTWRATVCNQAKDGSLYWVDSVIAPCFDEAGNIEKYISIRSDVTPARQLQTTLASEREHLSAILEGTSAGTWEWEVPSSQLIVNARWAQMLGYSLEELAPITLETWKHLSHPEDLAHAQALLDQHFAGTLPSYECEIRMRHRDGRWVWIQTRGKVTSWKKPGVPLWVSGIHLDISRHKQLQAELAQSNRVMQSILDNIPVALSVFDGDLNLVARNGKFAELLDFPDWLFSGPVTTFESIIRYNATRGEYGNGDLEQAIQAIIARARHTVKHQFERVRPNGLALEVRGAPMPGGGFVTTYADISERKKAEAEIASTSAMLQSVLDSASEVAVIAMGLDGLISLFNKGAERLLGYDASDVIGQLRLDRFIDPAELQTRSAMLSMQLGQPVQGLQALIDDSMLGQRTEWTYLRKDGHHFNAALVVTALTDASGQRTGYLGVSHDMSHEKNAQLALRAAMEDAEQAAMAKGQFLANMSHEIRTPMNAILGMLKLLQNTRLDTRQKDYTAKTESAARALMELLNDVLDFSKVEAGKMQLDPQPFLLDRVLRDLAVILSANAGGKNIEVLYDLDAALPAALVGDSVRLQQILTNLGSNAIKFTEHGEVVISITLEALEQGRATLQFSVRDSGIGIAPENQQRIFAGFSQAEASTTRRFGGTGLGLSICKRLVEMMGGELRLHSALGQGSNFQFRISLPVAPMPVHDATPATQSPLRVLVVDDHPPTCAAIARMAGSLGWNVDTANSVSDALQHLQQRATQGQPGYQVIFADWSLEGLPGQDTAQSLQQHSAGPAPAIIFLVTARGREILTERGDRTPLLAKPVTASMLQDAVKEARQTSAAGTPPPPVRKPRRLQGMRLLVVEDNPINQQVAKELLRAEGASIELAGNGQLGVDAVARAQPQFDAVLMDIQMPVMDGYTATVAIRHTLGLHTLPIIAMTANANASDREACLAAGMNDHIGKPFDLPQLIGMLQRHTHRAGTAAGAPAATSLREGDPAHCDTAGAIARLEGNTALYLQILKTFLDKLAGLSDQLDALLQNGDFQEAERLVHTTKGLALTVGAQGLATVCRTTEGDIRGAQPGNANAALSTAQAELRRTARVTEQFLQGVCTAMEATVEPPGPVPPASLDGTALLQGLRKLQGLLRTSDLQATDVLAALVQQHGAAAPGLLDDLQAAVAVLDFGHAARHCEALLGRLSAESRP